MRRLITILILFLFTTLLVFCGGRNKNLKVIEEYKIKVPEPSGLAFSYDGNHLWTVSDQNSTVYLLSLGGRIEKSFSVDAKDLEGITVVNDKTIAVVSERSGEILVLDVDGKEISRKKIIVNGKKNAGLEGITFDSKTGNYFLVKEKKPRLLICLDKYFRELNRTEINFADDLSDVFYEGESNNLWIISDESTLIAKCTVDGKVKDQRNVNINQIEGIAVNPKTKKIYLVSDKEEKLYVVDGF